MRIYKTFTEEIPSSKKKLFHIPICKRIIPLMRSILGAPGLTTLRWRVVRFFLMNLLTKSQYIKLSIVSTLFHFNCTKNIK